MEGEHLTDYQIICALEHADWTAPTWARPEYRFRVALDQLPEAPPMTDDEERAEALEELRYLVDIAYQTIGAVQTEAHAEIVRRFVRRAVVDSERESSDAE